eukprot:2044045-Rhodomonas_salina.1
MNQASITDADSRRETQTRADVRADGAGGGGLLYCIRRPGWPLERSAASRSSSCSSIVDLSNENKADFTPPLIKLDSPDGSPLATPSSLVEIPAKSISPPPSPAQHATCQTAQSPPHPGLL